MNFKTCASFSPGCAGPFLNSDHQTAIRIDRDLIEGSLDVFYRKTNAIGRQLDKILLTLEDIGPSAFSATFDEELVLRTEELTTAIRRRVADYPNEANRSVECDQSFEMKRDSAFVDVSVATWFAEQVACSLDTAEQLIGKCEGLRQCFDDLDDARSALHSALGLPPGRPSDTYARVRNTRLRVPPLPIFCWRKTPSWFPPLLKFRFLRSFCLRVYERQLSRYAERYCERLRTRAVEAFGNWLSEMRFEAGLVFSEQTDGTQMSHELVNSLLSRWRSASLLHSEESHMARLDSVPAEIRKCDSDRRVA